MEKVDTLVIGATFFGIGYAAAAREKCLVVESESLFGTDFVAAQKANACDTKKDYSAVAGEFLADAMKRNAVTGDGRVHIYALSGLLTKLATDKNCDIILNTSVCDINKKGDVFTVTLLNSDGFTEVEAKRVIDTRVPENASGEKFLSGMIVGEGGLNEFENSEIRILKGAFDGEYMLQVKLEMSDSWIEAREKFHSAFAKYRNDILNDWKIASVASSFGYSFDSALCYNEQGVEHKISASYNSFIDALQGGSTCA